MKCPRCGSEAVSIQAITDVNVKHRGCFGWLLWVLLAMCTCGLILIIPAMTNYRAKSKTHSEAICQNCAHRWRI